jgi:hypothetical protein
MTDRDASRLANYDAIVGAHLAWRARPLPETVLEYDAAAMEAARRAAHATDRHIVSGQVLRLLAIVHREGM